MRTAHIWTCLQALFTINPRQTQRPQKHSRSGGGPQASKLPPKPECVSPVLQDACMCNGMMPDVSISYADTILQPEIPTSGPELHICKCGPICHMRCIAVQPPLKHVIPGSRGCLYGTAQRYQGNLGNMGISTTTDMSQIVPLASDPNTSPTILRKQTEQYQDKTSPDTVEKNCRVPVQVRRNVRTQQEG